MPRKGRDGRERVRVEVRAVKVRFRGREDGLFGLARGRTTRPRGVDRGCIVLLRQPMLAM